MLPQPTERDLSAHEKVKLARLRARVAQRQNRIARQAPFLQQIAAAANAVQPNATALVAQAAQNPAVNHHNFRQWARDKLAQLQQHLDKKTVAMLVTAMSCLYLAYYLDPEVVPVAPPTWREWWWDKVMQTPTGPTPPRLDGAVEPFASPYDADHVTDTIFAAHNHHARPALVEATGVVGGGATMAGSSNQLPNLSAQDNFDADALRATIAAYRAEQRRQAQELAQFQAELASTANAMQPGATALVQQAAADPNVTPQNFAAWVRSKLPTMNRAALEVLVAALGILFVALVRHAAQEPEAAAESSSSTWMDMLRENQLSEELRRMWNALPSGPTVPLQPPGDGADQTYPMYQPGINAHPECENVVDAVFAKAEREAGGR